MNEAPTIFDAEEVLAKSGLDETVPASGLRCDRTKSGRLEEDQLNLLVKIDELGSIVRAAKVVGMSYKAAWDTIISLGNDFGKPLVCRFSDGKAGGVTRLTGAGKMIIVRLASET